MDASLWLVTVAQRCPLVRATYLGVANSLRRFCRETYLSKLRETLMHDLQTPREELQVRDRYADTSSFKKTQNKTSKHFSLLFISVCR